MSDNPRAEPVGTDPDADRDGRGLYGSKASPEAQRRAFTGGEIPVAVYGLGKMGLPLAAVYAAVAGDVTGVDVDPSVVDTVNRGECHVEREPGLPELVAEQVERGALRASADADSVAAASAVHVVIVPTLVTSGGEADLSALLAVVRSVARGLDPGDTVVVECTVPPGTCRGTLLPLVEAESGLEAGEFGLAFCPERTSSGKALEKIRRAHPKVVGGVDDESTRVATLIYGEITENDVIATPDASTAEAVKLFEGVYRDVNIALANELGRLADDLAIDANEAIEVANTQPFCDIHRPGVGVGGHCIPYYPHFLMGAVDTPTPLVRTGREVNESMPGFAVEKTCDLLAERGVDAEGARVLVLGVTYRPGVAETRATPAAPIIDGLRERGAEVFAADPLVGVEEFGARPATLDDLPDPLDAVVLVTAHEEFEAIDWDALDPLVVVDGRNVLDLADTDHLVYTVGSG